MMGTNQIFKSPLEGAHQAKEPTFDRFEGLFSKTVVFLLMYSCCTFAPSPALFH